LRHPLAPPMFRSPIRLKRRPPAQELSRALLNFAKRALP
jgi:hypothetical protein